MFDRVVNTPLRKLMFRPVKFLLVFEQSLCEKCPYLEFFGPYFPAFGLNTNQKNSNMDTFHAVSHCKCQHGPIVPWYQCSLFFSVDIKTSPSLYNLNKNSDTLKLFNFNFQAEQLLQKLKLQYGLMVDITIRQIQRLIVTGSQ